MKASVARKVREREELDLRGAAAVRGAAAGPEDWSCQFVQPLSANLRRQSPTDILEERKTLLQRLGSSCRRYNPAPICAFRISYDGPVIRAEVQGGLGQS